MNSVVTMRGTQRFARTSPPKRKFEEIPYSDVASPLVSPFKRLLEENRGSLDLIIPPLRRIYRALNNGFNALLNEFYPCCCSEEPLQVACHENPYRLESICLDCGQILTSRPLSNPGVVGSIPAWIGGCSFPMYGDNLSFYNSSSNSYNPVSKWSGYESWDITPETIELIRRRNNFEPLPMFCEGPANRRLLQNAPSTVSERWKHIVPTDNMPLMEDGKVQLPVFDKKKASPVTDS